MKHLPEGRRTVDDLSSLLKNNSEMSESGCLIYVKRKSRGYGHIGHNNKELLAHRAAWMVVNGPIPEGMLVCHKCDNPACINVDHLFLGTHKDNIQDCVSKGRRKKYKTECKRGHAFDEFNSGYLKGGQRYCKECNREASTARRRKLGKKEVGPRGYYLNSRKDQREYASQI